MQVRPVECKAAISRSGLPGLDWALNPYRGCAHGCLYCYAQDVTRFELGRPWGQTVEAKSNIASRLRAALRKGVSGVYGVGTVTDPYQPAEEQFRLTRACLIELKDRGASVSVLTKSPLVLRDLDLFSGWKGAEVGMTVSCADDTIARTLEPNAPLPSARFAALSKLSESSVDSYLMAAPIVPGITDSDELLSRLVESTRDAGIRRIIWDGFNPKPTALGRMRAAFPELDLGASAQLREKIFLARKTLKRECDACGIELSDAF